MFQPLSQLFTSTQATALAVVRAALLRDPTELDNRPTQAPTTQQETTDGTQTP